MLFALNMTDINMENDASVDDVRNRARSVIAQKFINTVKFIAVGTVLIFILLSAFKELLSDRGFQDKAKFDQILSGVQTISGIINHGARVLPISERNESSIGKNLL